MTKRKQDQPAVRRERRAFRAEFKAAAVRAWEEQREVGVSLAAVARELGVRTDSLRQWARGATTAAGPTGETLSDEVRRLRRENAVLRQEQAFAKKVAVYFAKESR